MLREFFDYSAKVIGKDSMKKNLEEVTFKKDENPVPISLDEKINYEEEFIPDIRQQWLETKKLSSCGIHRDCSWEDITGVNESLESINLLAGTLTKDEDTGKIYKAQPAISDKFKDDNRYNIAELKKGYSRKQLEEIITKIVAEVINDLDS
jgi:hypothetical protein